MTTVTENLEQWTGKRVIVTRNLSDGTSDEVEGTVEQGNQLGLLVKPKGKSSVEIIEAGQIEHVEPVPDKPKKLTPKYLKVVEFGQARQHLLDRHGATLTEVNGLSEEEAFEAHQSIDHEEEDLGHRHGEKPKRSDAESEDEEE